MDGITVSFLVAILLWIGWFVFDYFRFKKNEEQSKRWKERVREAGLPYKYWRPGVFRDED